MADLESKILDGPRDNYCSSSEDESDPLPGFKPESELQARMSVPKNPDGNYNTGPKGVLADWQRYKQLQTEQQAENQKELAELAQRLSMTCRTHKDDERAKVAEAKKQQMEENLSDDEDDFMREYMKKRMQEMMNAAANRTNTRKYGRLYSLETTDDFLEVIERDSQVVTIIIHIYDPTIMACEAMNGCLTSIAQDYPMIKFCRISAHILPITKNFRREALPTLQMYRKGDVIGNFVRLQDEFGQDFFADEIEQFLREHGFLPDLSAVEAAESRIKKMVENDDDSDLD